MDKRADDYEHNPTQHVILNPYQSSILKLRAKYATYESITAMLNVSNGLNSVMTGFPAAHDVTRAHGNHDASPTSGAGRVTDASISAPSVSRTFGE